MPELPEVETTKEGIKAFIENQIIESVVVRNSQLRLAVIPNIDELCANHTILAVSRRAKYILIKLSDGYLLIHLGMSGHLRIVPTNTPPGKHDHVDLNLKNKLSLRYCDPRRFGLFHYFTGNPSEHFLINHLGPEPLTKQFNSDYLYHKTRHKKQAIKSFIMNNEVVVGVGNIYATESLFLAGIHPLTPANAISIEQSTLLTYHIKMILRAAIKAGGSTLKDFYTFDGKPGYFSLFLKVYGRKNQPCTVCQTIIESQTIGGRASAFCPICQALTK